MVIASNPIKEKATTVAAVKTDIISTFACHNGSSVKIVPVPIPLYNWKPPITRNTAIKTNVKTTKIIFKPDVDFILYTLIPVTAMTYNTTQIQDGMCGNKCSI